LFQRRVDITLRALELIIARSAGLAKLLCHQLSRRGSKLAVNPGVDFEHGLRVGFALQLSHGLVDDSRVDVGKDFVPKSSNTPSFYLHPNLSLDYVSDHVPDLNSILCRYTLCDECMIGGSRAFVELLFLAGRVKRRRIFGGVPIIRTLVTLLTTKQKHIAVLSSAVTLAARARFASFFAVLSDTA
jgi:hypothetical protein